MQIDTQLQASDLTRQLEAFFDASVKRTNLLHEKRDPQAGAPVFTVKGNYTSRGWTEWTEGFLYGIPLLLSEITGEKKLYDLARAGIMKEMPKHLTHTGVHDHGFNNVSTYGNLRRLAIEGTNPDGEQDLALSELALRVSGAVQAMRWSVLKDGTGYIHSFNGPHSLFSDTVRSCRAVMLSHLLGHVLQGENDITIDLRQRATEHIANTLRYNVYYGDHRDAYDDEPGRVVHESIFNVTDGNYRCPSTQQGYTPFSTWTRGLAWVMTGCAEQLECWKAHGLGEEAPEVEKAMLVAAKATADFYINNTCKDGIPFWDTGAPGLRYLDDYREHDSVPDNPHEPLDSSAAAITAQGLIRLGLFLGDTDEGNKYLNAGLRVTQTLLSDKYQAQDPEHQGLLLHSVYHRPNDWDHIPEGASTPYGESSMWGDYHMVELALCVKRLSENAALPTFFVK